MYKIRKSALFERQLAEFAENYFQCAGPETADRFLDEVENAIEFIGKRPLACAIYQEARELPALREFEYRKWNLKVFPFSIFFTVLDGTTLSLEVIYAQRMDITGRMSSDIEER